MDYGNNGRNRIKLNAIDRLDCPQSCLNHWKLLELIELREPMELIEPMVPIYLMESIECKRWK